MFSLTLTISSKTFFGSICSSVTSVSITTAFSFVFVSELISSKFSKFSLFSFSFCLTKFWIFFILFCSTLFVSTLLFDSCVWLALFSERSFSPVSSLNSISIFAFLKSPPSEITLTSTFSSVVFSCFKPSSIAFSIVFALTSIFIFTPKKMLLSWIRNFNFFFFLFNWFIIHFVN